MNSGKEASWKKPWDIQGEQKLDKHVLFLLLVHVLGPDLWEKVSASPFALLEKHSSHLCFLKFCDLSCSLFYSFP